MATCKETINSRRLVAFHDQIMTFEPERRGQRGLSARFHTLVMKGVPSSSPGVGFLICRYFVCVSCTFSPHARTPYEHQRLDRSRHKARDSVLVDAAAWE